MPLQQRAGELGVGGRVRRRPWPAPARDSGARRTRRRGTPGSGSPALAARPPRRSRRRSRPRSCPPASEGTAAKPIVTRSTSSGASPPEARTVSRTASSEGTPVTPTVGSPPGPPGLEIVSGSAGDHRGQRALHDRGDGDEVDAALAGDAEVVDVEDREVGAARLQQLGGVRAARRLADLEVDARVLEVAAGAGGVERGVDGVGLEVEHQGRAFRRARFSAATVAAGGHGRAQRQGGRQQRGDPSHIGGERSGLRRHRVGGDGALDERGAARARGDPQGEPQQVRVLRGARPADPRPLPLVIDGLPDRLRVPDRAPRPRRRPARRAHLRLGADLPGLRDPGQADRAVQDARREGGGRQDRLRPRPRPGLEPRRDPRGHPRSAADWRSRTSSPSTSSSRGRRSRWTAGAPRRRRSR